jgi:hypothetical protein
MNNSDKGPDADARSTETTHEALIHGIRDLAVSRLNDGETARKLRGAKLTYGAGQRGLRGMCYYEAWENGLRQEFIEVCAAGEQSKVQLVGTTLHELAHCAAGFRAGHGPHWKKWAMSLGLARAQAAGQQYTVEDFDPLLWEQVVLLPPPSDGRPAFDLDEAVETGQRIAKARPCPLGIGTRNGISRGQGSGSRLFKLTCPHCSYAIWTTRKWLRKGAPQCPKGFCMKQV